MLILHLHSILFSKTKSIYAKKCTGQLKYWWNFYSCCLQMKIFRTGKFFPLRFCWIGMIKKRELRARISIFFLSFFTLSFTAVLSVYIDRKKFLCKCVDRIVNYSYKKTIFHWNWKEIFRNLLHMEIHHKNNSVQICFQYLKKSGKELWNSFFLKSDSLIC